MRLRSGNILPQAGTGAKCNGESCPESPDLGCPTYSGGDTVSYYVQSNMAADHQDTPEVITAISHPPSPVSSTHSLFQSPSSSPHSFEPSFSCYSSTTSPMSTSVVQEAEATTPAPTVGTSRTRKKWSEEMNIFILRTYFQITKSETGTKTYLTQLHTKFIEQFPNMQVTRQRLGDQRRAIVNNKLLTQDTINQIKEEVEHDLQIQADDRTDTPANHEYTQAQSSQRMRWSNTVNETIIRSYYKITNLETYKTAYRRPLYEAVITEHPHLSQVSEQRIADQRRTIVKNRMISEERLQQIREDVMNDLQRQNEITHTVQTPNTNTQGYTEIENMTHSLLTENTHSSNNNIQSNITAPETQTIHSSPNNLTPEKSNEIETTFQKALEDFKNSEPTERPHIPKQKPSKKFAAIVQYINNTILPKQLPPDTDFHTTQTTLYCAAITAVIHNGAKITNTGNNRLNTQQTPKWQRRIENKIKELRVKIGRLTEYIHGNNNQKIKKQIDAIKTQYKIHSQHENENTELTHFLDTLKQKLSALASRLRRYKQTTQRKIQNKQFNNNEKLFYRTLTQEHTNDKNLNNTETPTSEELYTFWSNIWSSPVEHNENEWIKEDKDIHTNLVEMPFENIDIDLLKSVIVKTHSWKATGSDKIHNYWYKKFTSVHPLLLTHINNFIHAPETLPQYITQGTTHMLPKDPSDTKNPAKYRPITCLQNIYKIITSCINKIIYRHVDNNNILAEEQKGCRRHSQGCKEQLVIDSIASKQAIAKKRNIYTMYIDYKKAYDSVPHSWLIYILQHYKIHPVIVEFLKSTMKNWCTRLKLTSKNSSVETEMIKIRKGIFQGDSLSPLWFCLALNPLSTLLNKSKQGFKIKHDNTQHVLTHLMYMDDIKLYGSNLQEIYKLADITQTFSSDIYMEFGIDKCKIQSVRRGKIENKSYQLTLMPYPFLPIHLKLYNGHRQT